jgi:hypothetical protein
MTFFTFLEKGCAVGCSRRRGILFGDLMNQWKAAHDGYHLHAR